MSRDTHRMDDLPSKPVRATLEQKLMILDYYHLSGGPQSDTVEKFKSLISISTSSFSEWLKHEPELRGRYDGTKDYFRNGKRKVHFKYEKINAAMDDMVENRKLKGLPLNEPVLREHWVLYAKEFGVDDPKRLEGFSHGWLSQFKKRHALDRSSMGKNQFTKLRALLPIPETLTGKFEAQGESYVRQENGTVSSNSSVQSEPYPMRPQRGFGYAGQVQNYLPLDNSFRDQPTFEQPFEQTRKRPRREKAPVEPVASQTQYASEVFSYKTPAEPVPMVFPETQPTPPTRLVLADLTANDVEKLMYVYVDGFLNTNAKDYPEAKKVFEQFKSTFVNERFNLEMRSSGNAQGMGDNIDRMIMQTVARDRHPR
ncbi:hypothetical protein BABINDRAFT_163933 [Babjeviella inositovora NRRL Y-12698]|uniref:HTH CENPB-type domain-containing protein n=1 Tax=Babjeviella inositovora NRRL Y-12698 TaxID=984486 RepID=A0A1E3QGV2_9ASCO|nr:uncharacterized protein BABINDRAFT_163933 [Babjeviella inositovora NRRL Y-12698]ODQ76929.1 hypothetical protein BABINDRAFT_163933 [Babjeviella inositovora NRRL Y-12698]